MSETRIISKHAGTVLVGQLATIAFGVADTMIAGRYSDSALAALSVGSALYISVYVALIGIVQALLPIWAELHGASRHEALGRSLQQSVYLCGLIVVAGMLALLFPATLLRWTQVPESMLAEIQHYLGILAWAFAPALLFRAYSTFNQSLGKPLLVTWLQLGALALKIPLSIWFVAGGAGVSPMGVAGCAWATLVVNYLLLTSAFVMLRWQPFYAPYRLWRALEAPRWREIGSFARLGIPAGLSYLVEVTSFTLMALFIARLGTTAAASHQIAASVAAVLYMMPLSLGIACSARVSFWLGAGDRNQARKVLLLGLKLTVGIALFFTTGTYLARNILATWYSNSAEIQVVAATLLVWVAFYHLADAIQAVSAFMLRCYRITVLPLILYGVFLWGVGLAGGYLVTYQGIGGQPPLQSASGFWAASTGALAMVAICFVGLLWRRARKNPR